MLAKIIKKSAGLQVPKVSDPIHKRFLERVAEYVQVAAGARGDALDRVITLRDFARNTGLAGILTSVGGAQSDLSSLIGGTGGGGEAAEVDLTPPTAVTGVSAAGATEHVIISWTATTDTNFSYYQIWRAPDDVQGNAAVVGTTEALVYSDLLGANLSAYYWLKGVNTSGIEGPFHALNGEFVGTNGVGSTDLASSLTVPEVLGVLPTVDNFDGRLVFLTTNKKLYRYSDTAAAFISSVDGADIDSVSIPAGAIVANSITAGQIAAGAVATSELAAGAITAGSGIIGSLAVDTAHIASAAITDVKVSSLSGSKITTNSLHANRIQSNTITATQIAANAINASEINAGQVTAAKMAANSITVGNGAIANLTVATAKIQGNAVTVPEGSQTAGSTVVGDSWVVAQSDSLDTDGEDLMIFGSFVMTASDACVYKMRLRSSQGTYPWGGSGGVTVGSLTNESAVHTISVHQVPGSATYTYYLEVARVSGNPPNVSQRTILLLGVKK